MKFKTFNFIFAIFYMFFFLACQVIYFYFKIKSLDFVFAGLTFLLFALIFLTLWSKQE